MNGTSERSRWNCHALLVGIDGYQRKPLRGCVNDIDAVQRLLHRAGVPDKQIRRLASPGGDRAEKVDRPGEPATLANIRAALAELGSDRVQPGDRVFIYFSGHGARAAVTRPKSRTLHRESLVAVDVDEAGQPRLLFDNELNQFLAAIAARTRSIAVVLDCCYSAGVTRQDGASEMMARCLDLEQDLGWKQEARAAPREGGHEGGLARGIGDCLVVAACLDHQLAYEEGERGGLLTRALVEALDGVDDEALPTVSWSRIWELVRAGVASRNGWQNPWIAGNAAREVFAGPPLDGDAGLAITDAGAGRYTIEAGTLAGVTIGARLGIYGHLPALFPPLDSHADHSARRGVLVVTSAGSSSAIAQAEGAEPILRPGDRARLIGAGDLSRLRCAVVLRPDGPDRAKRAPSALGALRAALRASPILELVEEKRQAVVWLERDVSGWSMTDDLHAAGPDHALVRFDAEDPECARALLEHYARYAMPLRMADLAVELRGELRLDVLACPAAIAPAEAQDADLEEAPSPGRSTYEVVAEAGICFRVRNTSDDTLRVTLLNSAASGKVQLLGDQSLVARSSAVFWAGNQLGKPFAMTPPPGRKRCVDRLIAIGTTRVASDLRHLRVDGTFAEILQRYRDTGLGELGPKDVDWRQCSSLPVEKWTAAQVVVRTSLPEPGLDPSRR